MTIGQLYNFYTKAIWKVWHELTEEFKSSGDMEEFLEDSVVQIIDIFQYQADALISEYVEEDFDYGFEDFNGRDFTLSEKECKDFIYNVYLLFKGVSVNGDLFFKKFILWRLEYFLLQIITLYYFNEELATEISYDYGFAMAVDSIIDRDWIESKENFYKILDNAKK